MIPEGLLKGRLSWLLLDEAHRLLCGWLSDASMKHIQRSTLRQIYRRSFLRNGAAFAAVVTAGPILAQSVTPLPPLSKGPRVWLDLDQAEIDAAYDQSVYAPNLPQIIKR